MGSIQRQIDAEERRQDSRIKASNPEFLRLRKCVSLDAELRWGGLTPEERSVLNDAMIEARDVAVDMLEARIADYVLYEQPRR